MRVALTGHRPERLRGKEDAVRRWIVEQLDKREYSEAYSGMAQGADQIFARVALFYEIPLICCYPYRKKNFHWEERDIISYTRDVRFISESYSKQCFWIRDKYMVDNCDILFAIWDGIEEGGTWLTIKYARSIGKEIIYFPREILLS